MYIQVIRGRVKDAEAMRSKGEEWQRELKPGAKGHLGSTAGVADDGTYINVVRFESEEAARANSDRPEQGSFWQETSKLFDGQPTFYDCPEVELTMGGGSDDAGFVQVMIYKPKDVAAIKASVKEFEKLAPMRPDIIGGTSAFAIDGTVIDTNYFTSEAEARAGEKQEMSPEIQELMKGFSENVGEVEFIDIKDPWLH
jgi:hypothetical protein